MEIGWIIWTVSITVLAVLILSLMIIHIARGATDTIRAKEAEQRRDERPEPEPVELMERMPTRKGTQYVVDEHVNKSQNRLWFSACAEEGFPHVLAAIKKDASAMIFETSNSQLDVVDCTGPIDSTTSNGHLYVGAIGFNDTDNSVKISILSMANNQLVTFVEHSVRNVAFTGRQDIILCDDRVLMRDDATIHVFRILADQRSLVRMQTMNNCQVDKVQSFKGFDEYAAIIGRTEWIQLRWNGERYESNRMQHQQENRVALRPTGELAIDESTRSTIHFDVSETDTIYRLDAEGRVFVNGQLVHRIRDTIEYVVSGESDVLFVLCRGNKMFTIHN